jgi:hypothetical protein
VRVRPYEKPLLAAIVCLACALALLLPAARRDLAGTDASASAGANPPAAASADAREAAAARPGAASAARIAPDGPCAERDTLTSGGRAATVAADRAGRFALYGPAGEDGRPPADSRDLLRGCLLREADDTGLVANPVLLDTGGPSVPLILGPNDLSRETQRGAGGSLVTEYASGGVAVTQTLSVVPGKAPRGPGSPDTLRASYEIRNDTGSARRVSLSAVLEPAKGPFSEENSGVPYLANYPLTDDRPGADPDARGREGAVAVADARTLLADRGEIPAEIIVPRPGAAASSTCYWRALGRGPDTIAFGTARSLAEDGAAAGGGNGPLGNASAFSPMWAGIRLDPGESTTVAYEYGLTSGWAR